MWKAIGKVIGKGLRWVIRNPQALDVIVDVIAPKKPQQKEVASAPDDR
jgi:hypothetical protein